MDALIELYNHKVCNASNDKASTSRMLYQENLPQFLVATDIDFIAVR
jgi:hypothetical protein